MKAWRLRSAIITLLWLLAVSSVFAAEAGMDALRTLSNKPWIMKSTSKTFLCTSLERMNMLSLLAKQRDAQAITQTIAEGRQVGEIEPIPVGTEVYFVKGVDRNFMMVRPVGVNKVYYVIRKTFDEGHAVKGD